jgi:hypothetical protein
VNDAVVKNGAAAPTVVVKCALNPTAVFVATAGSAPAA